ncbi:MAG: cobaltochelatase CobT-related protein [Ruminococcus sp.]
MQDYTILHRFREYDDQRSANENIFNYVTSSNNRDGLAIRAAGYGLLNREEEKKILIILSDGRPYDVIVNRPMRNQRHRIMEVCNYRHCSPDRKAAQPKSTCWVFFAGKDLATEKKKILEGFLPLYPEYYRIFKNRWKILQKQLEDDE